MKSKNILKRVVAVALAVITFTSVAMVGVPMKAEAAPLSAPVITRVFGGTRYDTAAAIADSVKAANNGVVDTVIIANATSFADALSGASFAAQKKAPILLTAGGTALEAAITNKLNSYKPKNIYIFGGPMAVSPDIESALKKAYTGATVIRLTGNNRYETCAAINGAMSKVSTTAFVVSGESYPDALSAAPIAGMMNSMILYSNAAGDIPTEEGQLLKSKGITKVYVIGGTTAISDSVVSNLKKYGVTTVERVSGASRYDTSIAIYNKFKGDGKFYAANKVAFATGADFADALAGGVYCATTKTPLLLLAPNDPNKKIVDIVEKNNLYNVTAFGGHNSINGLIFSNMFELEFEEIINGATGWATYDIPLREGAGTAKKQIGTVTAGKAFVILSESPDWWKINYNGTTGYVEYKHCMINLPDVLPDIKYDIKNAYSSIYMSSGYKLPNVTDTALYTYDKTRTSTDKCLDGKLYNARLGHNECVVPLVYGVAKKVAKAEKAAFRDGDTLLIYDSYRPKTVSTTILNSLTSLYNSNSTVKKKIDTAANGSSWGTGWFLSKGVSAHNVGVAIDVSLYSYKTGKEYTMPSKIHELSTAAVKYTSGFSAGSASQAPANYAASMKKNEDAKRLDQYCGKVNASGGQLGSLSSEWWHFEDRTLYNEIKPLTPNNNGCTFQITAPVSKVAGTAK